VLLMATQAGPISNDFRPGRCVGRYGLPELRRAGQLLPVRSHCKREDATHNAAKGEANNSGHATFHSLSRESRAPSALIKSLSCGLTNDNRERP
jgi:hypothetical protein